MPLRLSTTARNAASDAVVGLLDAGTGPGKLRIYSGGQPTNPQTAATGTLLLEVTLPDPASTAAVNGVDTILDPAAATGVGDGTAGWARFVDSNNAAVMDCSVSATGGGGDITLSTATISTGLTVDIAAIPYTTPQG